MLSFHLLGFCRGFVLLLIDSRTYNAGRRWLPFAVSVLKVQQDYYMELCPFLVSCRNLSEHLFPEDLT